MDKVQTTGKELIDFMNEQGDSVQSINKYSDQRSIISEEEEEEVLSENQIDTRVKRGKVLGSSKEVNREILR